MHKVYGVLHSSHPQWNPDGPFLIIEVLGRYHLLTCDIYMIDGQIPDWCEPITGNASLVIEWEIDYPERETVVEIGSATRTEFEDLFEMSTKPILKFINSNEYLCRGEVYK